MRPIPESLRGRPFTTRDAADAGVTRQMLRGDRFEAVHPGRGIWAVADDPRDLTFLLRADQLVLPQDAAVSHLTGLRLHGIEVGTPELRHWSTNRAVRRREKSIVLHRRQATLRPVDRDGLPVLPAHRCLVDAAISLSHRDIVRIADALVNAGLTTPDHFAAFAWADLVLPRWRIVLEYDGWYHDRTAAQRRKDILRREALEADGWLVLVFVSGDLDRPANLIGRVWRALVARDYPGPPPRFLPWELEEFARNPKA